VSDIAGYEPCAPKSPDYADRITTRADERRAEHPDVVFDDDGAALGIGWERVLGDMEMGLA